MKLFAPITAMLMICTPAAAADDYTARVIKKLAKMQPEDFVKGITIEEDDMSTAVVISSAKAFTLNQGILSQTQSDVALKAGIDKKTGRTVFRLVAGLAYSSGWRYYESATYMTDTGPVDVPLVVDTRDVNCVSVGCFYSEKVGFEVPEEILRARAGKSEVWKLRFTARQGPDRDEVMSPLEIRAMLAAVYRYRKH